MEELMDRIIVDPQITAGKPVIKGNRTTVQLIVQLLANGETEAEILEDYPDLKKEDIKAALLYRRNVSIMKREFQCRNWGTSFGAGA